MKKFRKFLSKTWVLSFTVALVTICTISLYAGISMFRAYNESKVEASDYVKPKLTIHQDTNSSQPTDKDMSLEKAVDLGGRIIFQIFGADLNDFEANGYLNEDKNLRVWTINFMIPTNDIVYKCVVNSVTGRILAAGEGHRYIIKNDSESSPKPFSSELTGQEKSDLQVKWDQLSNDKEILRISDNIVNKYLLYRKSIKQSRVFDIRLKDIRCHAIEENGGIKLQFERLLEPDRLGLVNIRTELSDGSYYITSISFDSKKIIGIISSDVMTEELKSSFN